MKKDRFETIISPSATRKWVCRLTSKCVGIIECSIQKSGLLTGSLLILMVLLTCYDVIMRYVFQAGSVGAQELEWHLFSAIFLLGGAFTLKEDQHVRVDLFYRSKLFSKKMKARIDILGALIFLIPFCLIIIWASVPFAYEAYIHREMSPDPGGLKYRWIVKSMVPLGFFLVLIQGLITVKLNSSLLMTRK